MEIDSGMMMEDILGFTRGWSTNNGLLGICPPFIIIQQKDSVNHNSTNQCTNVYWSL